MESKTEKNNRAASKRGKVVSDKMDKTRVVSVTEFKTHAKYKKKYKSTKHYKAHDPENRYKTGDMVEIVPTKPISKSKFYKVAKIA